MEEHPEARIIIERLAKAGYIAYYAGGWVRDFLLSHPSEDIDIATNASPEVVQKLFEKTIPIGIAFGIILVVVNSKEYEVATFRCDFDYQDGRRPSKIAFTTAQEDAKRRDFTINGMFYDPLKSEIIDFVGGKEDLEKKVIRAIGNPHDRFAEDRLRMIRAIRLSTRFQFGIDEKTQAAIHDHANELLPSVAIERVVQELEKGHNYNKLRPMLIELHRFGLLSTIFPTLKTLSLKDLEIRLEPLRYFPHKAPLIAFLLELFPELPIEEQIELCKRLKLPNDAQKFTLFLHDAKKLIQKKNDRYEWASFYSHRFSPEVLPILAAHQPNREKFIQEHEAQIKSLEIEIERLRLRTPVITAEDLQKEGIQPGPAMGLLLKEAEKISINFGSDKDKTLEELKKRPEWPL